MESYQMEEMEKLLNMQKQMKLSLQKQDQFLISLIEYDLKINKKYQNGKIYKIVDKTNGNIYIGSTCEKLVRRLSKHVSSYKVYCRNKKDYTSSYEILKNGDYEIILIESFPCKGKDELHKQERYHIDKTKCINKNNPTRTKEDDKLYHKKYYKDNKNIIKEKHKLYNEVNKEQEAIRHKKYYSDNKGIILKKNQEHYKKVKDELLKTIECVCGGSYCKMSSQRHLRTSKHQSFLLLTDKNQSI